MIKYQLLPKVIVHTFKIEQILLFFCLDFFKQGTQRNNQQKIAQLVWAAIVSNTRCISFRQSMQCLLLICILNALLLTLILTHFPEWNPFRSRNNKPLYFQMPPIVLKPFLPSLNDRQIPAFATFSSSSAKTQQKIATDPNSVLGNIRSNIRSKEITKNKLREMQNTEYFRSQTHQKSVVITGMIKNGEPLLYGLLLQIEKLSCNFAYADIVILESNSIDNTTKLLNVWKKRPIHCDRKAIQMMHKKQQNEKNRVCSNNYSQQKLSAQEKEMIEKIAVNDKKLKKRLIKKVKKEKCEINFNMNYVINEESFVHTHKHIIHFDDEKEENFKSYTREDRFVFYRNYILDYVTKELVWKASTQSELASDSVHAQYMYKYGKSKPFMYDWWIMIDFDVQALDWRMIFKEFSISSQLLDVDVFCVNGLEWNGRYRDSFATVFHDGKWCYDDGIQCHQVLQQNRFTKVQSCFGGLTIYNFQQIADSECRYYTKNELQTSAYNTHEWFERQDEKFEKICEHIAFHDCLYSKVDNLTMIISRDSHLYYGFQIYDKWEQEPILYGTA